MNEYTNLQCDISVHFLINRGQKSAQLRAKFCRYEYFTTDCIVFEDVNYVSHKVHMPFSVVLKV